MAAACRSSRSSACALCGTPLGPGAVLSPVASSLAVAGMRAPCLWACAPCAADRAPPPCKHWLMRGACAFRETCMFEHDAEKKGAMKDAFMSERRRGNGNVSRRRLRNRDKVSCMRRFLSATFGADRMRAGTGVLDVAGGKGHLAFELVNLLGVPATVVDPRPLELRACENMLKAGHYHKNAVLSADTIPPPAVPTAPKHMPVLFEEKLFAATRAGSIAHDEWNAACARASELRWSRKGLRSLDGDDSERYAYEGIGAAKLNSSAPRCLDGGVVDTVDAAAALLQGASLVTGLHVDQAAGAMVDYALETRTPFAVVPCCVYKAEFPKRRFADGTKVSTYDQLCDWLQARDPGIRRDHLPFEGKNVVLWWDGNNM